MFNTGSESLCCAPFLRCVCVNNDLVQEMEHQHSMLAEKLEGVQKHCKEKVPPSLSLIASVSWSLITPQLIPPLFQTTHLETQLRTAQACFTHTSRTSHILHTYFTRTSHARHTHFTRTAAAPHCLRLVIPSHAASDCEPVLQTLTMSASTTIEAAAAQA